jgi:alanine racemase
LDQIAEWMNDREPRRAAIHIDTGLNRLGLAVEEAYGAADAAAWSSLQVELVLSHLACATTPEHVMNQAQRRRFEALSGLWPTAQRSLSNTAGIYLGGPYRHNVVRPGVGLYGGGPFERPHSDLRPVVTFCAPIVQIRRISPGESVGYGAAWRAERATTVAIVAAGYADGVLRALGSAGYGWLAGRARPFLGRISMDLIALDVTDCPAAHPGAMVELLGDKVLLNDVASRAQTAPYEILTAIGRRAQRVVVGAQ